MARPIEIYHGAHGKFETKSPIRTFVAYRIQNEPYLLAAYQCTPLVKMPVAELKAGAHVKGTTIAELGNRNRPLDMIVYQKDGKDYLLMTNNSRGVMKIPTEGAATAPEHHPARHRWRQEGPGLRHDRQPQGRRPDGSARRSPCRDPHPGQGHRDGQPLHHRIAVTFRPYLLLLAACGAFPLLEGIVPARSASPSADDRPAPAEDRPSR